MRVIVEAPINPKTFDLVRLYEDLRTTAFHDSTLLRGSKTSSPALPPKPPKKPSIRTASYSDILAYRTQMMRYRDEGNPNADKEDTCQLLWKRTSKAAAMCRCRTLVRSGAYYPGTMSIEVSPAAYDEDTLRGIVAHEMIHEEFYLKGQPNENHGPNFQRRALDIGERLGLVVPLTHKSSVGEFTNLPRRRCFAIMAIRNGWEWFAFYSHSAPFLQDPESPRVDFILNTLLRNGYTWAGVVEVDTQLYVKLPIQRDLNRRSGLRLTQIPGSLSDAVNVVRVLQHKGTLYGDDNAKLLSSLSA